MILIKKYKIFFFLTALFLLLNNCSSVKKAFDPERKNGSDEFLVEKKSPLSMPPDFDKLPEPKSDKTENNLIDDNVEYLITKDENNGDGNNIIEDDFGSTEEEILELIKNN